jgi:hypothetical protein
VSAWLGYEMVCLMGTEVGLYSFGHRKDSRGMLPRILLCLRGLVVSIGQFLMLGFGISA